MSRLLADAPNNWGKWGADDEIGALNYLTGERNQIRGYAAVRQQHPFTLGAPLATAAGDPVFPGRWAARHYMVADKAGFEAGHWRALPGGLEFADDYVSGFAQAGTHCDALGHMWFDDTLWNGYPAASTNGGMTKASIEQIARRGIVGRAVLLDLARFRGEDVPAASRDLRSSRSPEMRASSGGRDRAPFDSDAADRLARRATREAKSGSTSIIGSRG